MKNIKQCLIVDDDMDDQEIFRMCLDRLDSDIACVSANNGVEAIKMLEADPEYIPEYIFIDMNMPKMNGIECLKKIKEIDRLKLSKIYMYSTTSEKTVVKESKDLGADDFIIKPVKTLELTEKLAQIFGTVSGTRTK